MLVAQHFRRTPENHYEVDATTAPATNSRSTVTRRPAVPCTGASHGCLPSCKAPTERGNASTRSALRVRYRTPALETRRRIRSLADHTDMECVE